MSYPGRNNIYESVIRKRVSQALEKQEQDFRSEHENDSDEQLLEYVRSAARESGCSPCRGEIVGCDMLLERFGTWDRVLRSAGLPAPKKVKPRTSFARIKEEDARQRELYRQNKTKKKPPTGAAKAQPSEKVPEPCGGAPRETV